MRHNKIKKTLQTQSILKLKKIKHTRDGCLKFPDVFMETILLDSVHNTRGSRMNIFETKTRIEMQTGCFSSTSQSNVMDRNVGLVL